MIVTPSSPTDRNAAVVDDMTRAHAAITSAIDAADRGDHLRVQELVVRADGFANAALSGARDLGAANILEGAVHRYGLHTVRGLSALRSAIESPVGIDATRLADSLNGVRIMANLGREAGERSLARGIVRPLDQARPASSIANRAGSHDTVHPAPDSRAGQIHAGGGLRQTSGDTQVHAGAGGWGDQIHAGAGDGHGQVHPGNGVSAEV